MYETPGAAIYRSRKWNRYRWQLLQESAGICELCNGMYDSSYLRIHHKIALTEHNVNDLEIVYGKNNLQVLCANCHNEIHRRFDKTAPAKSERKVYIISGAPMSGKTTFVQDAAGKFDLIVDLDKIFQALSINPLYEKPDELSSAVFAVRDTLYDIIRTRAGKHHSAYIISGRNIGELERLAKQLSGELIIIESTLDECLSRLENDSSGRDKANWKKYISDWFEKNKNYFEKNQDQ